MMHIGSGGVENCELYRKTVDAASQSYILRCPAILTSLQTHAVSYEKIIKTQEALTLQNLRELSSSRAAFSNSLAKYARQQQRSGGGAGAGEEGDHLEDTHRWAERYVSLLLNFAHKYEHTEKRKTLMFRWAGFCGGDGARHFELRDVRHELAMVMILQAAALREMGYAKAEASKLDSVKRAATGVTTTSADDIALSATMLRRAAGIYDFVSCDTAHSQGDEAMLAAAGLLQKLKEERALPANRPAELSMSVNVAFHFLCLADVQSLTAGRAEAKTAAVLFTDERERREKKLQCVSFGTVSALFRAAANFYDTASGHIKHNASEYNSISGLLLDLLAVSQQLALARALRCHALQKREDCQPGEAIRSCETALQALAFCKEVASGRKMSDWLKQASIEADILRELLHKVKTENQVVYFQTVPEAASLPPEKVLVSTLAFQPQIKRQNLFIDA